MHQRVPDRVVELINHLYDEFLDEWEYQCESFPDTKDGDYYCLFAMINTLYLLFASYIKYCPKDQRPFILTQIIDRLKEFTQNCP